MLLMFPHIYGNFLPAHIPARKGTTRLPPVLVGENNTWATMTENTSTMTLHVHRRGRPICVVVGSRGSRGQSTVVAVEGNGPSVPSNSKTSSFNHNRHSSSLDGRNRVGSAGQRRMDSQ
eukprot:GHVU01029920.1.p1 GENE.GHVU01029920.1~~GHVU01029920.1.p1  ORF type:complete len:119 (+),score=1.49 GHVU01029920.1:145-501(+)